MKTFSLQLINLLSLVGSLKLFSEWNVACDLSVKLILAGCLIICCLTCVKHSLSETPKFWFITCWALYSIPSYFTCQLGLKTLLKKPKSEIMHNYGVHLCVFNRGHNLAHPVRRILELKEWSERQGDSETIILLKVSCQKVHYSNDVWR